MQVLSKHLSKGFYHLFIFFFYINFIACSLPPSDNSPRFLEVDEFIKISTLTKAKDLTRAGRLPQAELLLRNLIHNNPDMMIAKNDLGYLLLLEERYIEAEKILVEVISLQPYFVPARLNLARVFVSTHRFEKAITQYEEIEHIANLLNAREYEEFNRKVLEPFFLASIKRMKASSYYLLGQYDEAVCYSNLSQAESANLQEFNVHVRLLLSLELLSSAHNILRTALMVHQQNLPPSIIFDYALTLVAIGTYETATLVIDRVLETPNLSIEERTAARFLRYALEKKPSEALLLKESLLDDALSPCKRTKFDTAGYWPNKAKELIISAYNDICIAL